MKRYDIDTSNCEGGGSYCGAGMEENPEGEYILYVEFEKTESLLQKIVDTAFGINQLLSPKQKIDVINKLILDKVL